MIEGGAYGSKRVVNINSLHPNSTETVYIGDSYLAESDRECESEGVDRDDFNYFRKGRNFWTLKTSNNGMFKLMNHDLETTYDTYEVKIN